MISRNKHRADSYSDGCTLFWAKKMSSLREKLAAAYEQEEEYLEAAKILQGIPLDSGHRYVVYEGLK